MDLQEIRQRLSRILLANPPGKTEVHGCHGQMEIYAHLFHHQVVAPQLIALHDAGLIGAVDDKGHDTEFSRAWNRVITGMGETWDCRSVTDALLKAATVGMTTEWFFSPEPDFDLINKAILDHLPGYLSGEGIEKPVTNRAMRSWMTGDNVWLRMDGYQPALCQRDGSPLQEFALKRGGVVFELPGDQACDIVAIMGFHADGIEYDTSIKAWEAWMGKARPLSPEGSWDSVAGLLTRQLSCQTDLGISWLSLRQDEGVSVDAGPEGFTIYRGTVDGMKTIHDEGQLQIGTRNAWMDILVDGGFSKAGAGAFLDGLIQGNGAFSAHVPAGSKAMICIDPETLYAFDMDDSEMCRATSKDDALPIFAAGTFDLPEMMTWRQRRAEALPAVPEEGMEP